jgi:hypothetical protein
MFVMHELSNLPALEYDALWSNIWEVFCPAFICVSPWHGMTPIISVPPIIRPCQGDTHMNAGQNTSQILDQRASYSRAGRLDSSCITNISSNLGSTPSKSIRPLTQAYKAAQSEHEVSMSSNTPSKNDGIVSRAMEYIFGW